MFSSEATPAQQILEAATFAALKHRKQRRKNVEGDPYINHPIAVADLLARVGRVSDVTILQAALLHDTLEDTETTPAELEQHFGPEVCRIVEELTDDKKLPKARRKRLQVEHAPHLSPGAALIKIADKIANVTDVTPTDPAGWSTAQKREYILWAQEVVDNLHLKNRSLRTFFNRLCKDKRALLDS